MDNNEEDNQVQEAKCLYTLSNNKFRNILVAHFDKLQELGKHIWPSKSGKMVRGSLFYPCIYHIFIQNSIFVPVSIVVEYKNVSTNLFIYLFFKTFLYLY